MTTQTGAATTSVPYEGRHNDCDCGIMRTTSNRHRQHCWDSVWGRKFD